MLRQQQHCSAGQRRHLLVASIVALLCLLLAAAATTEARRMSRDEMREVIQQLDGEGGLIVSLSERTTICMHACLPEALCAAGHCPPENPPIVLLARLTLLSHVPLPRHSDWFL